MAKITHSDAAPSEVVHYVVPDSSGGTTEFDLGPRKKSYETTDRVLLGNAAVNPWLAVEYDEVELIAGGYREQLPATEDHLSGAFAFDPNDPAEVAKAEAAKGEAFDQPVALDAGKDQSVPVVEGGVAETLAADETSKTSDKVSD